MNKRFKGTDTCAHKGTASSFDSPFRAQKTQVHQRPTRGITSFPVPVLFYSIKITIPSNVEDKGNQRY